MHCGRDEGGQGQGDKALRGWELTAKSRTGSELSNFAAEASM